MRASILRMSGDGKPIYRILHNGKEYRLYEGSYSLMRLRKTVDEVHVSIMHDRHKTLRDRIDIAVGELDALLS